jgi:hypothetical protein
MFGQVGTRQATSNLVPQSTRSMKQDGCKTETGSPPPLREGLCLFRLVVRLSTVRKSEDSPACGGRSADSAFGLTPGSYPFLDQPWYFVLSCHSGIARLSSLAKRERRVEVQYREDPVSRKLWGSTYASIPQSQRMYFEQLLHKGVPCPRRRRHVVSLSGAI